MRRPYDPGSRGGASTAVAVPPPIMAGSCSMIFTARPVAGSTHTRVETSPSGLVNS